MADHDANMMQPRPVHSLLRPFAPYTAAQIKRAVTNRHASPHTL